MKVLLALAVLATSASALAADNRQIFDLMYLPNTGTTYGFSDFSYLKAELDFGTGTAEISGPAFAQTIGHSFTDRFSFEGQIGYQNYEGENSVSNDTSETSGLTDPRFTARFRAMDESFRLDVLGGAVVSLGDSETEDNGDSNALRGGSSLFTGAQFGGKSESFQWAMTSLLTHNFESTTDDESNGKTDDDAHNELMLQLDLLAKLGEQSYLRPHVSATFTEAYDDEDGDEVQAANTFYIAGLEFRQVMSTDLMLKAGVDYGISNQASGQVDDFTLWRFTAGANYQF